MPALRITWLTLPLLWGLTACGGSAPTTTPNVPLADPAPDRAGGAVLMGAYEARFGIVDGNPVATVEPLGMAPRAGQKVGDLFVLEVADYFQSDPCGDCFGVTGLGLSPSGDLEVDLQMQHPFRTTSLRADLDVFDPRVLFLTDQNAVTFSGMDPVLGGRLGDTVAAPSLEPGLILGADGYTARYDWIAEDASVVGTPRDYDGTLNPYLDFFTEDDPDPVAEGLPIANRRMAMASNVDAKRLTISREALEARGSQLPALLLIEVSYGASAERRIDAPNPGARLAPVYFLPAFNRKEPVVLEAIAPPPYTQGQVGQVQSVGVAISDWQAGLTGVGVSNFAVAPDYAGTDEIPVTSTLTKVKFSAPALNGAVQTITNFPTGTGTLDDPWQLSIGLLNSLQPPAGTYYGLLSAQDSYHGSQNLPGLEVGGNATSTGDYQSFQVVPFVVEVNSNAVPSAALKARKQGDVAWTLPPATLTVNTGQVVEFTLADSTDPESAWATPAAFYDLDAAAGTGGDGGFEINSSVITNIVSTTYATSGLRAVRGKVRDGAFQFSSDATISVDVQAVVNAPPVAHIKARKQGTPTWTVPPATLTVSTGETVEFTLTDSTDAEGLWANPAAYFDLDASAGTGGDGGFEVNSAAIANIVTTSYASAGSRAVRGKVKDAALQFSGVDTVTVVVSGIPTCYNTTNLGVQIPIDLEEHGADTVNGKIYMFGGYSATASPSRPIHGYVFDPVANTYTATSDGLNGYAAGQGREGNDVVGVGNRAYVVGGTGTFVATCSNDFNPTDYYDAVSGTWSGMGLANLNPNLWRCAGVAYNGRIFLPGGFRSFNEFSCGSYVNSVNTTTVYNPTTNSWSNLNEFGQAIPAFAARRWAHGTGVLYGKLTIFPGQYEDAAGFQGHVWTVNEYDLTTAGASWVAKDTAPSSRWLYELEVVNNRAYIIGGLNQAGNPQNTVWQYDPTRASGQQWSTLTTSCGGSPLPVNLYNYGSAVYNGEIYLFGGVTLFSPRTYNRNTYKLTVQ